TFVWDWASGLPEMLSEGQATGGEPVALYLAGHETLGQWDSASPGGAEEWAYYLPDGLGSVRQVTDAAGAVTDAREWTPYGVEVGAAQAELGYTGEWQDPVLGLTYLRARWYDSYLNQFVSPDPIVPDHWDPHSINGYTYALGNPIRYTDPDGLAPLPPPYPPPQTLVPDPRDLTKWLYNEMIANATSPEVRGLLALNEISRHLREGITCDLSTAMALAGGGDPIVNYLLSLTGFNIQYRIWSADEAAAVFHVAALFWYRELVKNKAVWDFKDEMGLRLGPGITLCTSPSTCYNDVEFSVPGNVHFAYIGVIAGFPGWEIQAGAAAADITDPARDPNSKEYVPGLPPGVVSITNLDPSTWNFGDEARDHEAVTCGIKMAERYGVLMTYSQFQSELSLYIGEFDRCTPDPGPPDEDVLRTWSGNGFTYPLGYFDNQGESYEPPGRCR
ncbi:MAG: RHS repeat-associated core domain-containing protein, partial [Chloroflexota bacterium]